MFDIAWTEMAVIAVLALIVLGPKELPVALKTLGQWVGRARAMARDFQRGIEDIARDTELDKIKQQIESVCALDLEQAIENSIDPTGDAARALDFSGESGSPANALPDSGGGRQSAADTEPAAEAAPDPSDATPPSRRSPA
ncbi:MAG: Sec-independent protein translocase protein TatB [Alphaproteobacteria bacterium]